MDIRKVKKLIELLEESGIAEIEISEGDDSVRISRFPQPGMYAAPPMMAAPAPMPATTPVAPEETPNTPAPEALPSAGETVVAPMVGTFYSSPAPGALKEPTVSGFVRFSHGGPMGAKSFGTRHIETICGYLSRNPVPSTFPSAHALRSSSKG